jgi:hypothetical protein
MSTMPGSFCEEVYRFVPVMKDSCLQSSQTWVLQGLWQ